MLKRAAWLALKIEAVLFLILAAAVILTNTFLQPGPHSDSLVLVYEPCLTVAVSCGGNCQSLEVGSNRDEDLSWPGRMVVGAPTSNCHLERQVHVTRFKTPPADPPDST